MTTTEAISEELFQFLEKKSVKEVFGHITEQMLMYKPNNVVRFVVKTLNNDFPDEATALEEGEVKIHETFQLFGEGEGGEGGGRGGGKEFDDGTVKRSANSGGFVPETVALGNHDQAPRVHVTEGNSRTMDQLHDTQVERNFAHLFGAQALAPKPGEAPADALAAAAITAEGGAAEGSAAVAGEDGPAGGGGGDGVGEAKDADEPKQKEEPAVGAAPRPQPAAAAKEGGGGGEDSDGDGSSGGDPLPSDAELLAQFGHLFPVLEKHALFAHMERWEWLQVCRNLEETRSRKHDMVCKMGDGGHGQDGLYIIEEGTVEVFVMQAVEAQAAPELSAQEREAREREVQRKANLKAMGLKDDVKVQKKKDREAQIQEELRRKQAKQAKAAAKGARRTKKVLATYSRGDTFGELALLYPCKHEASVLVTSPKATFWRLSRRAYKVLCNLFLHERARRRLAVINQTRIFSPLTTEEKAVLADALEVETFRKGDVVVQQGALHEKIFLLTEGVVSLSQRNNVGRQVELCRVGPGHAFAEHALITMRPSQMSAVVVSPVLQCYTLTKAQFILCFGAMTDILRRDPAFNSELMALLI